MIFSNPIFIKVLIIAIIIGLWIISICIVWSWRYRKGYTDCIQNIRAKKKARREHSRTFKNGEVRVLKFNNKPGEFSTVRVVSTHKPKLEKKVTRNDRRPC